MLEFLTLVSFPVVFYTNMAYFSKACGAPITKLQLLVYKLGSLCLLINIFSFTTQ